MKPQARFVPLFYVWGGIFLLVAILLVVGNIVSQPLFAQESATKAVGESPEPAAMERASRSKTHCEIPECVEKVIYLSNISQPSEMQDVVNAMRTIAEISRVQQIPAARMIIIEGTSEQVALGEKLAGEIDRSFGRFGRLGYRIELKVRERGADGKDRTKIYSLLTRARQNSKVSVGRQGPVQGQSEPAGDGKQASDSGNTGIECWIWEENEHTVGVKVEFRLPAEGERESGGTSPVLRGKQDLQVELDKPTVISRVDDPDSGRSYMVELTATRVK